MALSHRSASLSPSHRAETPHWPLHHVIQTLPSNAPVSLWTRGRLLNPPPLCRLTHYSRALMNYLLFRDRLLCQVPSQPHARPTPAPPAFHLSHALPSWNPRARPQPPLHCQRSQRATGILCHPRPDLISDKEKNARRSTRVVLAQGVKSKSTGTARYHQSTCQSNCAMLLSTFPGLTSMRNSSLTHRCIPSPLLSPRGASREAVTCDARPRSGLQAGRG